MAKSKISWRLAWGSFLLLWWNTLAECGQRFILAHSCRLQSIVAGQSWKQDLKTVVSHLQLRAGRRNMHMLAAQLRTQTRGGVLLTFRTGLLVSVSVLRQCLTEVDRANMTETTPLDCVNSTTKTTYHRYLQRPAEFTAGWSCLSEATHSSIGVLSIVNTRHLLLAQQYMELFHFPDQAHLLNQMLICTQLGTCV